MPPFWNLRGAFIREGHLIERGVYRIFLGLYWAFIGEGRLKESGRLSEKIWYITNMFLYFVLPSLRPSQIACTVTTLHITCMQTVLHAHKNLCTLLIPLCQKYLSQSKGSFPFILLCRWEKYRKGPLALCINYIKMISELYQHMYLLKNYLSVINIS